MKIIFLDIDGVLNLIPQGRDKYGDIFHPHFVANLKRLIDVTGAKIVISSTWRMSGFDVMKNMWKDRKLPGDVIGITPIGYHLSQRDFNFKKWKDRTMPRGVEIQYWLDNTKDNIDNYVILDDDTDMTKFQFDNHYVKTSGNMGHPDCIDIGYGLTKICTDKAIKILNR